MLCHLMDINIDPLVKEKAAERLARNKARLDALNVATIEVLRRAGQERADRDRLAKEKLTSNLPNP